MTDMEYNRTSPFISNSLHYSSEIYPYVGEFAYLCTQFFLTEHLFRKRNPPDSRQLQ